MARVHRPTAPPDEPTDLDDAGADGVDDAKGKLRMLIALILVSVVLAAVAQLTLKYGMNHVHAATGVVQLSARSLRSIASTPAVWIGLALFALSASIWLAVLSRASLSFAYPFVSLTYVLILVFDRFILHQPVSGLRWAGVALIVGGIALVAQTPHG
jgi:drug/metabolite transporter (DMT)-like permease